jgi:organic hydroperoxide reductase OsmC/OhrA
MTDRSHQYQVRVEWTGNLGEGTRGYGAYSRSHQVSASGKPPIPASSDPAFRGDPTRYNPEELLVASLSACHMLWYLHLCADAGIVVTEYADDARGTMVEAAGSGGHFTEVVLRPVVTVLPGAGPERAAALHERAHQLCFVASSVRFPVRCEPTIREAQA